MTLSFRIKGMVSDEAIGGFCQLKAGHNRVRDKTLIV